ncbi:MAG: NTP transferase domain-containing protein [Bacteroidaceae bacterium]|nr:NTP transferase domain-containing protein [Bacteroidaceae bacterium]
MNALIFAAGLGTRLKPLTDTMPKAMVPINGKPLVQILIEKLKSIGVSEVVINVHHFAQQIIDFIEANDRFGIDIRFSDETDQLLETGGGLKKAARLFSNADPILVHNVDILSNADLLGLYNEGVATGTTTLLVSQRDTQRYLLFDDANRLVGWTNIATGEIRSPFPEIKALESNCQLSTVNYQLKKFAFSGIQVFHPSLLPLMDTWQGKFSIIDFYLSICDKVDIRCHFAPQLQLLDVGKLDTIAKAEAFVQQQSE